MPDVVLVYPPMTKPAAPPAGVARLAGWLRAAGVPCEAIDARLEFLEAHLDPSHGEAFRRPEFYRDPDRYLGALARLTEALRRLAPAGEQLTPTDHRPPHEPLFSRRTILRSVQESRIFLPYLESLAARIRDLNPRVVGISIAYLGQLVAGLQLERILREIAPGIRVAFGGSLITAWRAHLDGAGILGGERFLFGPGEVSFRPLLDEAGIEIAPRGSAPRVEELLARHRYFAPEPIATLAVTEGCYWGKCTFCIEAGGIPFRMPEEGDLARVAGDLAAQGARMLHFTDHALPPAVARDLARILRGRDLRWHGFLRFEPALADPAFAEALAASGCAMVELGLESGSPRVLEAMRKGIDLEVAGRAIRSLDAAGIRVFLYVLFGFPTETDEDRAMTLRFLEEHAGSIHGINTALFNLPVGSILEREPARFGIRRLMPFRPDQELSLYRDFVSGHDRLAVRRFLRDSYEKSAALAPVLRRTPPGFKSDHAAFMAKGA
ncbi:MAG: radical SAM protein [Planctomycetes bacterium]|nr:radical SAM protein [Planctomycetota bacterium]